METWQGNTAGLHTVTTVAGLDKYFRCRHNGNWWAKRPVLERVSHTAVTPQSLGNTEVFKGNQGNTSLHATWEVTSGLMVGKWQPWSLGKTQKTERSWWISTHLFKKSFRTLHYPARKIFPLSKEMMILLSPAPHFFFLSPKLSRFTG